jgi:hypothetical protein
LCIKTPLFKKAFYPEQEVTRPAAVRTIAFAKSPQGRVNGVNHTFWGFFDKSNEWPVWLSRTR